MTTPDLDSLQAGRALDVLVHKWVFGEIVPTDHNVDDPHCDCVPRYSTDIAAAWSVVTTLREQGWLVRVQEMPDGYPWLLDDDDPRAKLFRKSVCMLYWQPRATPDDLHKFIHTHPWGYGHESPEAICRAALKATDGAE